MPQMPNRHNILLGKHLFYLHIQEAGRHETEISKIVQADVNLNSWIFRFSSIWYKRHEAKRSLASGKGIFNWTGENKGHPHTGLKLLKLREELTSIFSQQCSKKNMQIIYFFIVTGVGLLAFKTGRPLCGSVLP